MQQHSGTGKAGRSSIRLNLRWLPWACGLLVVLQAAAPYRGWVMLGIALALVWLSGWLWARSLARGTRRVAAGALEIVVGARADGGAGRCD